MAKVRFGLKNVHYAVLTEGATPAWGTPVAIPGAVALDLEQEGGRENFYADNTAYYVTYSNNGYSGSLEVARIPDQMLEDIWGMAADTSGVTIENNGTEPKPFALLFQTETDTGNVRVALYRCYADRPNVGSQTTEDTATPQTQTINISAVPVVGGALDGRVKVSTTEETPEAIINAWFNSVYGTTSGE